MDSMHCGTMDSVKLSRPRWARKSYVCVCVLCTYMCVMCVMCHASYFCATFEQFIIIIECIPLNKSKSCVEAVIDVVLLKTVKWQNSYLLARVWTLYMYMYINIINEWKTCLFQNESDVVFVLISFFRFSFDFLGTYVSTCLCRFYWMKYKPIPTYMRY